MLGIDISNWQAGFNITNSGVDFCIVKATEGVESYQQRKQGSGVLR